MARGKDLGHQTMQRMLLKLVDETLGGIFIDKKQWLLDEETKALGKLMVDNLSTVVAAMQHRWEQWVSWAETVEGLETSDLTLLREPWIKNLSHVSS